MIYTERQQRAWGKRKDKVFSELLRLRETANREGLLRKLTIGEKDRSTLYMERAPWEKRVAIFHHKEMCMMGDWKDVIHEITSDEKLRELIREYDVTSEHVKKLTKLITRAG